MTHWMPNSICYANRSGKRKQLGSTFLVGDWDSRASSAELLATSSRRWTTSIALLRLAANADCIRATLLPTNIYAVLSLCPRFFGVFNCLAGVFSWVNAAMFGTDIDRMLSQAPPPCNLPII